MHKNFLNTTYNFLMQPKYLQKIHWEMKIHGKLQPQQSLVVNNNL